MSNKPNTRNQRRINGHLFDPLSRPGEERITADNAPPAGAINAYHCQECGKLTIVQHIDAGVTPSFLGCRNPKCENTFATSMGYPPNPPQRVVDAVRWEWYRPEWDEFRKMERPMQTHILAGGLVLREKVFEDEVEEEKLDG